LFANTSSYGGITRSPTPRPISKTGGSERSDFNQIGNIQDKEAALIQNSGKGLLKREQNMLRDGYKYVIKKICESCHLLSHCHKVIMAYDEEIKRKRKITNIFDLQGKSIVKKNTHQSTRGH
jgi:predicted metal-binding protein